MINLKNIKALSLSNRLIKDISLLKDADLDVLEIANCAITDISPIKDKNIKYLNLGGGIINLEIILSLKKLETLIIVPKSLKPGWEEIIIKMKDQLKGIGIGPGDYLKSVDQFIKEFKGINNQNPKK